MKDEGRPARNGRRRHQPEETRARQVAGFRGALPRLGATCDIEGTAVVRLVAESAEDEDALRAHLGEIVATLASALRLAA